MRALPSRGENPDSGGTVKRILTHPAVVALLVIAAIFGASWGTYLVGGAS